MSQASREIEIAEERKGSCELRFPLFIGADKKLMARDRIYSMVAVLVSVVSFSLENI